MDERATLEQALAGDAVAIRTLVRMLLPVVQARAARALSRRRGASGRDVRQEVEDLAQDVFAAIFAHECRVLRAWDPERGLSLASFCGLVAEREVASILRSGRRSPWTEAATEADSLEKELGESPDVEVGVASREHVERVLDRLRETLSPKGLELFERLVMDEETVEEVCSKTGLSADAVYAWKSRLAKLVRKLAAEVARSEPNVIAPKNVSEDAASPRSATEETP